MASVKLLVESLNQFSPEQFEEFKSLIGVVKGFPLTSRRQLKAANLQAVLELMAETYGQESVEVVKRALMKMNRADLVQKLSAVHSGVKEVQLSPLTQRVKKMESVLELLLESLADLSDVELKCFRILWRPNDCSKIFWNSVLLEAADLKNTVFSLVQNYREDSVEETQKILHCMKRTDLVERLWDCSSKPKKKRRDDHLSALIHKAASVAVVKRLVFETLIDLKEYEFERFKWFVHLTHFHKSLPQISWSKMELADRRGLVELMYTAASLQCVEVTVEVLLDMNRTDLVENLPKERSDSEVKLPVDDLWPQLIHTVKEMESKAKRLLEYLSDLNHSDRMDFKKILSHVQNYGPYLSISCRLLGMKEDLQDAVLLMVQTYSPCFEEKIVEVLMETMRTFMLCRLSEPTLQRAKKRLADKRSSVLIHKVALMAAVKTQLLEILNKLNNKEFEKFRRLLQARVPLDVPDSWSVTQDKSRAEMANEMVEELGRRSLEVTREILKAMNRTDLLKMMETSSGIKVKLSVGQHGEDGHTALKMNLQKRLKDLNRKDLQTFWALLVLTCYHTGFPVILSAWWDMQPAEVLVDLMVENLGQRADEVFWDVLKQINRTDLDLKYMHSSASEGPSRRLDPGGCGHLMQESHETGLLQDTSGWTKLQPVVNKAATYSLQSEAGHFECSVSGLRWVCEDKVDFKYRFCSWEGHMERMEGRQFRPAGPLMDITIIKGKLSEVHLPHWICIDDIPNLLDNFAVLHINDCGDVLEKVSEVTPTHVKIPEPEFSLIAALINYFFPPRIKCKTLIYYGPNTSFLKLHVYLIPPDPALQQSVHEDESSSGYEEIKKPRPDKFLRIEQGFSLRATLTTAKIQPQEITLRHDSRDPNFYEVFIENPDRNFNLELLQTCSEKVWCCEIRKDDHPKSGPGPGPGPGPERRSMDDLPEMMQNAATIREKLLKVFDDLRRNELERFKWYLKGRGISESQLENKSTLDLVDLMLQTFSQQAVQVTKEVFSEINRNDLAGNL